MFINASKFIESTESLAIDTSHKIIGEIKIKIESQKDIETETNYR